MDYVFFTVLHFEQRLSSRAGRVSCWKGQTCFAFKTLIWLGRAWQSSSKLLVSLQRWDSYSVSDILAA